ncbi:MAG: hypothetical protein KDJ65_37160, partial [Anaerolineae bacterium]|nr:hypothetical protein [Anaerolineae bacterium]
MARKPKRQPDNPTAKSILKTLKSICTLSGQRPSVVWDDFLLITEAELQRLPDNVKAIAATGRPAEDPPEIKRAYAQIRVRYRPRLTDAWRCFSEAFCQLTEVTDGGLWSATTPTGLSGPDILGDIYQTWSNIDPAWAGQYFTPWPVALMMARLLVPHGEREIFDRIKKALLHGANQLGQALLLAGMAIPDDDALFARDYFFNRVLPAAMPFYDPLTVNEPAVGSGIMLLAAASTFPEWAVKLGLVRFTGQDLDQTCVR